jgi:lipopolysaccharide export LptBFGC system permease protein LptF
MKPNFYFILASFFLVACGESKQPAIDMQGNWESHSLTITMPTWQDGDSTMVITANPENWLEVMQIQPIKSYLNADKTYLAEYRDLAGNLTQRYSGTWSVTGNVVTYYEEFPKPDTFVQTVTKLSEKLYQLQSYMDFDHDGEEDDEAMAIYRKLK